MNPSRKSLRGAIVWKLQICFFIFNFYCSSTFVGLLGNSNYNGTELMCHGPKHLVPPPNDPAARSEPRVRTLKQSQPQHRLVAEVIFHASAAARRGTAWPGWLLVLMPPDYSVLWSPARCGSTPLRFLCEHPRAACVLSLFRQRRGSLRLAHFHPAQRLKLTLLHLPASCLRQSQLRIIKMNLCCQLTDGCKIWASTSFSIKQQLEIQTHFSIKWLLYLLFIVLVFDPEPGKILF